MADRSVRVGQREVHVRPSWKEPGRGTRVRVALWLLDEVGEGNTFTKAMLRDAFPGVEQVDRRMRDLRSFGWQIFTVREDASLRVGELRFVAQGAPVWDPAQQGGGQNTPTAKERREVLERDSYACVHCGISAGERHPGGGFRRAQVGVSRIEGSDKLVTECDLCRAGDVRVPTSSSMIDSFEELTDAEARDFMTWVAANRRRPRRADRLWSAFRRLSADDRAEVAASLAAVMRARDEG